jgi:hypothetical protein
MNSGVAGSGLTVERRLRYVPRLSPLVVSLVESQLPHAALLRAGAADVSTDGLPP